MGAHRLELEPLPKGTDLALLVSTVLSRIGTDPPRMYHFDGIPCKAVVAIAAGVELMRMNEVADLAGVSPSSIGLNLKNIPHLVALSKQKLFFRGDAEYVQYLFNPKKPGRRSR